MKVNKHNQLDSLLSKVCLRKIMKLMPITYNYNFTTLFDGIVLSNNIFKAYWKLEQIFDFVIK